MAADLDPSEVTRVLELPPDHVHRKGDLRIGRTKKGRVVQYSPYAAGMWSMSSENRVQANRLEPHVAWILDEIEPVRDRFLGLLAAGVTGDVFCYAFGDERDHVVTRSTRARAESLGLEIVIDHYPVEDASGDEHA